MREVITEWTTPSGGGKLSVMYFDDTQTIANTRAALGTMWGAIDAQLDNAVTWTIRTSGRELNPGTGALEGEWSESTAQTGTGALVGQCTADATQCLIRWSTGIVVNGRFLKGRTFVPGLESNGFTDGNLSTPVQTAFNNAINTFLGTVTVEPMIWHRPVAGAGGSAHNISSGVVWRELAVLRRRRN